MASSVALRPLLTKQELADLLRCSPRTDLAGEIFRDEVTKLGDWYAGSGTKSGYEVDADEAGSRSTSVIEASLS